MIPEKSFAGKRIRNLLIPMCLWVVLIVFFFFRYNGGFERLIVNLILSLTLFALFALCLVNRRIHGSFADNTSEDYRGICLVTIVSVALLILFSWLPHFLTPFLIIAFLYTRGACPEVAMVLTSGMAVFFTVNRGGSVYELSASILLALAGTVLTPLYANKKNRPLLSFIILCVSVLIPGIFSYIPEGMFRPVVIFGSILLGLAADLIFLLLFDRMILIVEKRQEVEIRRIIKPDYPLLSEIRSFSPSTYEHAKKVSLLAAKCAAAAGLDVAVSAAGGMYYRLGVLAGEPVTENGVKLAQINCFPVPVIQILYEYYGFEAPISTPESAVVNMADTLVRRFESLRDKVEGNEWNREILIYKTLNDKLSTGLYDKSGLSINHFLKIREFLVRGDDLG